MNNVYEMRWTLAVCRLSVLSIALMMTPMTTLAEKAPGYENYKEGYKGYLGDGILKQGESETSELARAVQNPIADLISVSFQNNTNFEFGPRERTQIGKPTVTIPGRCRWAADSDASCALAVNR